MIAHRYDVNGYYACSVEDLGYPPINSTYDELPPLPWEKRWPKFVNNMWTLDEDHRERKGKEFANGLEQDATLYWEEGDSWDSSPKVMSTPGPLPSNSSLTRPEKPEEILVKEAKIVKLAEIDEKYYSALNAALVNLNGNSSPQDLIIQTSLYASIDPESVEFIVEKLQGQRNAYKDALETYTLLGQVQALHINYLV